MARWYRAYEGTISDPKLHEVALICGLSRAIVIACWHAILESCASVQNEIYEVTPRRIALMLQEPVESINSVIEALGEIGLLQSGTVTSWSKRQYVSDNSTERAKKSREKKQLESQPQTVENVSTTLQEQNNTDNETTLQRFSNVAEATTQRCNNVTETTTKRFCNAPETETDTETKTEEKNTRNENELAQVAESATIAPTLALVPSLPKPRAEIKQAPGKKREAQDHEIFKLLWEGLIGNAGIRLADKDRQAQAKAAWLIVDRIVVQFDHHDRIDATKSILDGFTRLRKSGGKFWGTQPQTPLALSAQGIWGQVLESMREAKQDPEIEKLIEAMVF